MGSVPTDQAMRYDNNTPIAPPISMISSVSARNCSLMWRLRAPSARRRPISRIRSSTDEHDIHHTHAADPERESANESEKHLQPDRERVDHGAKFIAAEHLQGFWVGRREILTRGDGG